MYITVKSIKRNLGFKGIEFSDLIIGIPILTISIILFLFTPLKLFSIIFLMVGFFCLLPINVSKKNRMYKALIMVFSYIFRKKYFVNYSEEVNYEKEK